MQAWDAASNFHSAAQSLDESGFSGLSDELIANAGKLLNVAVGVARVSNLVDVPMNLMEAFSGKTLEFDDQGKASLRDTSSVERAFAIGALAIGAVAVASGGWTVALGATVVGTIGKAATKNMMKEATEKAAKEAAEHGASAAAREAAEKAAKEAAEKEGEKITKEAASGPAGLTEPAGSAKNRAAHELYKKEARRSMEKPVVKDKILQTNYIDQLYKITASIGSGSTADAVRYERLTGQQVRGKWHTEKAENLLEGLKNWQKSNSNADNTDKEIVEHLIKDLEDALL